MERIHAAIKGLMGTGTNLKSKVLIDFPGKLVILGFGSIGQGALPLILRHIGIDRKNITIVTGDTGGSAIARKEGIEFRVEPLNPQNYHSILQPLLGEGGFLLNLSVDVSSVQLVRFCQEIGALYLDACIEPWTGGYVDPTLTMTQRSNYGLRETLLGLKKDFPQGHTAVVAHGANPGIVSHFLKRALLQIAHDTEYAAEKPTSREEWAKLARDLEVKTIHIAEYDSQVTDKPKVIGRFENTWSVYGFHAEGVCQPSEVGWGTHEKYWPENARKHDTGCGAGIYFLQPGVRTLTRTWTPLHKNFIGRIVTHNEAISICDFLTLRNGDEVAYRPTVNYAYRPCDAAVLSLEETMGKNSQLQDEQRILLDEITSGMDELGILVMGHKKGAYWYGSQLTIDETRKLAPYQNATGLQVTAGVLGGMIWAMENPKSGVMEPDEVDFERVMEIAEPYLGTMTGEYTDWTPLKGREMLFPEDIDIADPWQFKNFRII